MVQYSPELFKLYQEALINADIGYWESIVDTKRIVWNEAFRKFYHFGEGEYSCTTEEWGSKIHVDDRERFKSHLNAVMSSDINVDIRYRVVLKNNSIKYVRSRAFKVIKDGKIVKLVGLHWDITDESLLQIELTEAKEFTASILNAIPAPIFVKNEKFETIYANSEYQKFINLPREKFIGKNDYEVFPKKVADVFRNTDVEVFENNISLEYETTIDNSQGEPRDIYSKKSLIKISPNKKYLVGAFFDITELKNIQKSLIKQSKMASLGEMAAEIAHEVNNPLMIIQGKSQILLSKINSKNIDMGNCKKDLEQIETNCIRIDKIIKSLKSVTRKADLDPFEDVSLRRLIDEAFLISFVRFGKKNISLSISCDDQIGVNRKISARPSEIVQVLVNLLNNSYDAVQDQKNAWAKINLTSKKSFYLIEITDSGSEILPEIAQKMMEPFFTTKSSGQGTGLGLSVSKQIIRNHGGEMYYDPAKPNTCFIFTLPKI